jgi:hypothetical protein
MSASPDNGGGDHKAASRDSDEDTSNIDIEILLTQAEASVLEALALRAGGGRGHETSTLQHHLDSRSGQSTVQEQTSSLF